MSRIDTPPESTTNAYRDPTASTADDSTRRPLQREIPADDPGPTEPRSLRDLLKELRDESQTLLRQEVALAKTEISEKIDRATSNVIKVAVGLGTAALGGVVLLIALANLVSAAFEFIDNDWISGAIGYAIVGLITAVIGYAIYKSGLTRLKRESLTPEQTLESLKDDKQWLQHKTH